MSERVEVRGVIASKQGLSCAGFYLLFNRTAHLRTRLYVTVRDGGKVFRPKDPHEHFPAWEIRDYYENQIAVLLVESIGAGGGEVVFSCEGISPSAAGEGAETIQAALPDVDAIVNQPWMARWAAALPEKVRYTDTTMPRSAGPGGYPAAYRPPGCPANRTGPHEPEGPVSMFRKGLRARGMLSDWDRMWGAPRLDRKRRHEEDPMEVMEARRQRTAEVLERLYGNREEDLWT